MSTPTRLPFVFVSVIACGGRLETSDGGTSPDAGGPKDATPIDVTVPLDAPPPPPPPVDAGSVVVLASGLSSPFGLQVDANNVYWSTLVPLSGQILKCAKGGCGSSPTVLVDGRPEPFIVALDATRVYWTEFGGTGVASCNALSGCNDTPTLYGGAGTTGQGGLVVQSTNVYWTDATTTSIFACPVSGCSSPTTIATNQGYLAGIAADANNVYWVQFDAGAIASCGLSGCGGNPKSLVSSLKQPLWLVVDATNVYWSTYVGTVATCPLTGCATPQVLVETNHTWIGLALDDQDVYMSDFDGKTISKCAKTGCGGNATIVAANQDGPRDLAVDATSVYWANETGNTIMKIAK